MMANSTPMKNIDNQISEYVSALSDKNKKVILSVLKSISENEEEAEFEKKWASAVPLDAVFEELHSHIKTLKWKK